MDMGGRVRLTREQWYLMAALGCVKFSIFLSVSFQWPLFPGEAEKKGASATEYGLVIGIHALGSFISGPIYGNYINRIGAKKILSYGIFVAGIAVAGFGLLDLIASHVPFITMAFVMTILHSLGAAAAITSSHSITVVTFYDSIATSIAMTEAVGGFGLILGPILGGYLFQVGGYMLPFLVVGVLLLTLSGIMFFLFPDVYDQRNLDLTRVRVSSVLVLVPVLLDLFSRMTAAISTGFIIALLEPHLRQFNLNPVTLGGIFVIGTGLYTLFTPVVGYLCDTIFYSKNIIIIGGLLMLLSISLIGPAPFLPMDTTLWAVCVGLAFNGIGLACILVPTFIDAIHSAVGQGLPNDLALYGVVSGIAHSAFSLGDGLGPSIAGLLFDAFGFRNASVFFLVMQAVVVIAMASYVCTERRARHPLFVEPALNYASITNSVDETRPKFYVYQSI